MLIDAHPGIIVAVISGIASLLGAIFSLVQAKRTVQLTSRATMLVEQFKAEDEKRRRAFEIATQESEPLVTACRQAWGDIQVVRNVINKVLAPARYDLQSALAEVRPAASSISKVYNEWGATLPTTTERALHTAKNTASLVESLLVQRATAKAAEPEASLRVDDRLREIRESLRDTQTVIQDALLKIRAEQMKRILEVM